MIGRLINSNGISLVRESGLLLAALAGLLNTTLASKMNILIVEDDEDRAKELKQYMQTKSIRIITARDGMEALMILRKQIVPIDLILSDSNMPAMDGFRLAKEVKKLFTTPFFLYSSRRITEDNKNLAMELGADHCLDNTEIDGIGSEALTVFAAL